MKKLILIAAITLLASCSNDNAPETNYSLKTAAGTYICGGTNLKGQRVMFTIYQGRNMMYLLDANGSVRHHQVTTISNQKDRQLYCQEHGYTNTDC